MIRPTEIYLNDFIKEESTTRQILTS